MAKKLFPDGGSFLLRPGDPQRPAGLRVGHDLARFEGRVQGKDAAEQTTITMRKIEAALKKAGCKLSDLTQMTIFVTDIRDMGAVSKALGKALKGSGRDLDPGGGERARRARPGGRDRKHGRGRELNTRPASSTGPADRGYDCG